MTRTDWPLGPALKAARLKAGLAVRAAARRTNGAISSGRWYQLESGYQRMRGHDIEIGTTPATVIAAAKAVDWDVAEALSVAGFRSDESQYQEPPAGPLDHISDDDLAAEVLRRMKGAHRGMEVTPKQDAPSEGNEGQEGNVVRPAHWGGGDNPPLPPGLTDEGVAASQGEKESDAEPDEGEAEDSDTEDEPEDPDEAR